MQVLVRGYWVSCLLLVILSSACSSSDSAREPRQVLEDFEDTIEGSATSVPSGEIRFVGYVEFYVNEPNEEVSVRAEFSELDEVADAQVLAAQARALPDSCLLEDDDFYAADPVFGRELEYVTAGDTVLLSSNGNTYGELVLDDSFDTGPFYRMDQPVYPLPYPLMIDVVGDVFPSFAPVQIPEFSQLEGFGFVGAAVDSSVFPNYVPLDTEIRWQVANADDSNLVQIEIQLGGFQSLPSKILVCSAKDDGSFFVPTLIRQQILDEYNIDPQTSIMFISPPGFSGHERNTAFIRQLGNALLVVRLERNFGVPE